MRFDFFRSLALTAIFTLEMGHAVKLENVEAVFHNAPAWAELDNQPVIPFKLSQIDNQSIAEKDDPKSGDSTIEEKVVSTESDFSDGKDAEKAKDEVNEKIKEKEDQAITDKVKKIDAVTDKDDTKGTTQQKPDEAKIKADAEKKKEEKPMTKEEAEAKKKADAKAKAEAEAKAIAKAKAEEQAKKDAEHLASLKAKFKVQDNALLDMSKKVQTLEKQLKESEAKHRKWESLQLVMDLEKSTAKIPSKDGAIKAPPASTTTKPDAKAGAAAAAKTEVKA